MEKTLRKMLLALLIVAFVASMLSISIVKAEEEIDSYDNVSAEQVVGDINNTVNSGASEGEIRYDQNYTFYSLTVFPKSVFIGQSVTAVAETDNSRVTHVTFVWVKPFSGIKKIETVNVYSENGRKKANSTYTPDELGSWWVFALFIKSTNTGSCKCGWLYAMRWACFKVAKITQRIPDYPVVGTAGAMTTMLVGLGLFLNKKRQKPF
ncbi:MAG: hypothetical protein ACPL1Z_06155 [Candidatus Bathyarchaeales archaeon]